MLALADARPGGFRPARLRVTPRAPSCPCRPGHPSALLSEKRVIPVQADASDEPSCVLMGWFPYFTPDYNTTWDEVPSRFPSKRGGARAMKLLTLELSCGDPLERFRRYLPIDTSLEAFALFSLLSRKIGLEIRPRGVCQLACCPACRWVLTRSGGVSANACQEKRAVVELLLPSAMEVKLYKSLRRCSHLRSVACWVLHWTS